MKLKRRRKHGAEVSTHSLNDIMFFLLLFFLIISTMANPSVIKVLLPEAADNQEKEAQKTLQLTVDANKVYYLNGEELSPEQLDLRLAALAKSNPETSCSINIEKTLPVQVLIDVMTIGERNKIKMNIKTARPK